MIRTDWDYTGLADAYIHRPGYCDTAIDRLFELTGLRGGERAIDLGAGTGHLTVKLVERGLDVLALEPNDEMRRHGIRQTRLHPGVLWVEGVMERTGQADDAFALASYGSSFGVVDRLTTLREASRILRPSGWFACMWNHRDLDDPLQQEIETFIKTSIPSYAYGTRREDQAEVVVRSGLFGEVRRIEAARVHRMSASDWVKAWSSHATLRRQAGARFQAVVEGISTIVARRCRQTVEVPYTTRVWAAQLKRTEPLSGLG